MGEGSANSDKTTKPSNSTEKRTEILRKQCPRCSQLNECALPYPSPKHCRIKCGNCQELFPAVIEESKPEDTESMNSDSSTRYYLRKPSRTESNDSRQKFCSECQETIGDRFSVECKTCRTSLHGDCVDVAEEEAESADAFNCRDCLSKLRADDAGPTVDGTEKPKSRKRQRKKDDQPASSDTDYTPAVKRPVINQDNNNMTNTTPGNTTAGNSAAPAAPLSANLAADRSVHSGLLSSAGLTGATVAGDAAGLGAGDAFNMVTDSEAAAQMAAARLHQQQLQAQIQYQQYQQYLQQQLSEDFMKRFMVDKQMAKKQFIQSRAREVLKQALPSFQGMLTTDITRQLACILFFHCLERGEPQVQAAQFVCKITGCTVDDIRQWCNDMNGQYERQLDDQSNGGSATKNTDRPTRSSPAIDRTADELSRKSNSSPDVCQSENSSSAANVARTVPPEFMVPQLGMQYPYNLQAAQAMRVMQQAGMGAMTQGGMVPQSGMGIPPNLVPPAGAFGITNGIPGSGMNSQTTPDQSMATPAMTVPASYFK
eukprot:52790_1